MYSFQNLSTLCGFMAFTYSTNMCMQEPPDYVKEVLLPLISLPLDLIHSVWFSPSPLVHKIPWLFSGSSEILLSLQWNPHPKPIFFHLSVMDSCHNISGWNP